MSENKGPDKGIYVESIIRTHIDDLWEKTQNPDLHQRWDLRFSEIEFLSLNEELNTKLFSYSTRIGFGLNISGMGESLGNRDNKDGSKTSSLKFWSDDPRSLVREGSGYWKYIPTEKGIKFVTWYDYKTRFGIIGRNIDALMFRPLIRWATAWSFDRLRLWVEKKIDPLLSLERSIIYSISRGIIIFVWIYQGMVPKLLFHHTDEITMMLATGIKQSQVLSFVGFVGWVEIGFAVFLLFAWGIRNLFLVNIVLMVIALIEVASNSPQFLISAFNPVSLNLTIIAVSIIGFISGKDLPSAKRCKLLNYEAEV
jgi:hypothetical protein